MEDKVRLDIDIDIDIYRYRYRYRYTILFLPVCTDLLLSASYTFLPILPILTIATAIGTAFAIPIRTTGHSFVNIYKNTYI